jgi:hypothetical protein
MFTKTSNCNHHLDHCENTTKYIHKPVTTSLLFYTAVTALRSTAPTERDSGGKAIVSVTVGKKVHMNAFNSVLLPRYKCVNLLHFCLWGWRRSKVYERKVDT